MCNGVDGLVMMPARPPPSWQPPPPSLRPTTCPAPASLYDSISASLSTFLAATSLVFCSRSHELADSSSGPRTRPPALWKGGGGRAWGFRDASLCMGVQRCITPHGGSEMHHSTWGFRNASLCMGVQRCITPHDCLGACLSSCIHSYHPARVHGWQLFLWGYLGF